MRSQLMAPALAFAVSAAASVVWAQNPADRPVFEAVSIKRSPADAAPGAAGPRPGGRYVMTNGPTRVLISAAYPSPGNEIIGAPEWVTYENYDVHASAGREVSYDELMAMMRTTLGDRFKLAVRYETRERPVYALVLARADGSLGPRLRRTKTDCAAMNAAVEAGKLPPVPPPADGSPVPACTMKVNRGSMVSSGFSMEGLAGNLSRPAGRVVVDGTGLAGDYDFTLEWAPDPAGTDGLPSLFTALQEQLGLKLEPAEAPLPVVVIGRIERPTPD